MKKCILAILLHVGLGGFLFAATEPENTLQIWAAEYRSGVSHGHPSIAVAAYLKAGPGKHSLVFRLTNLGKKPLKLYPNELPWGNPHSLTLAAFTTDGQRIPNIYPIADPPPEKEMTIPPRASREGDNLDWSLDLSAAPKDRNRVITGSVPHNPTFLTGSVPHNPTFWSASPR